MSDCVFCKIVKGDEKSWAVYEDDRVFAFLDAFPVTEGHVIVAYKKHVEDLFKLPEDDFLHLVSVGRRIAMAMEEKLEAEFVNMITAQSVIDHAFLHVIPRYDYDLMGVVPDLENKRALDDKEMKLVCEKIKGGLNAGKED